MLMPTKSHGMGLVILFGNNGIITSASYEKTNGNNKWVIKIDLDDGFIDI